MLESKGDLLIDLNNNNESDFIKTTKFKIGGTLILNPLDTFYSGNSKFNIMNFEEIEGETFKNLNVLKPNFGRLNQKVVYMHNGIDLMLLNPNYENLVEKERARSIGRHIDNFTNLTSASFQEILDQINYIESDNELSNVLESLITPNDYKYFIERIESLESNTKQGLFIGKSNYDLNSKQTNHESKINRLDINYYGLNIAYMNMEADSNSKLVKSYSDSDAQEISYKIPLTFLDIILSSYKQDSKSKTFRTLPIESSAFQANAARDFDIKQDSINFAKEFDADFGNFRLGFSYSSINLSTDPFSEILNSTSSDYALEDVDFDFYTPHFEYSKDPSLLREEILRLTREYSRLVHSSFRPASDQYRIAWQKGSSIPYAGRVFTEDEVEAAVSSSLDFWLTLGVEGDAFQSEFSEFLGVRYSLLVNSGSSANLIAISTLTSPKLPDDRRIKAGDEVITVAAGFPTTVTFAGMFL